MEPASRPTRKSACFIPTTPTATRSARISRRARPRPGFTIIDPGPYEDGTTDYSAQIAKFKAEKCEIFNTFPIPPDFAAFWRQAAQQGYTKMVKIAQIAKTGLFPSEVTALGNLGYNLASAAYWHKAFPYKSSLTGVSGDELADGYEKASGKMWTQQLGATLALFDAGAAALTASGDPSNKDSPRQGDVHFEDGHDRWSDRLHLRTGAERLARARSSARNGSRRRPGRRFPLDYPVTENATDPKVPIQAKLRPFNS